MLEPIEARVHGCELRVNGRKLEVHAVLERVELPIHPFLEREETQIERLVGHEIAPPTGGTIEQDVGATHT